ncbi:hypothetical protein [Leuconostoc suionicum]|uniref:hypothetical protein n=1 Tax=Leuconostoc suionicum TaxID=1511761 RepID=UPI00233F2D28|nr:hypothetical protein [Leuconostoc suionicum]MDC2805371.1 hypothetical protein [Leuconostoc suionicum]MDC2822883.1 hypothetical protein [Leuconostoc suionicum]
MHNFFIFLWFFVTLAFWATLIMLVIHKLKNKPNKFTWKTPLMLFTAGLFFLISIGATADSSSKNSSTSDTSSNKSAEVKTSTNDSSSKAKESSEKAASSRASESASVVASSQSAAASESASIVASSQSAAASESASIVASSQSAAASESASIVASSQSAAASQARANSESEYQQAQTQHTSPDSSTVTANGNINSTGAYKWAIQDGFNWDTRKGHSTRIAPGQALPAGYHWQIQ